MPTQQKAWLETEGGDSIPCMFNPAELSIAVSNSWTEDAVPGRPAPDLYFTGGNSGTMALSLLFDTTSSGTTVTDHTDKVLGLLQIDPSLPGNYDEEIQNGRPPWVKFHWGDLHAFTAIVESLNLSFTYFSGEGMPLRARAELSLKQFEPSDNWGPQNPTSGTPKPHRVHQVQKGETLDRISAKHYGDSTKWRLIAEANGIVDPLALHPGSLLSIPKLRSR